MTPKDLVPAPVPPGPGAGAAPAGVARTGPAPEGGQPRLVDPLGAPAVFDDEAWRFETIARLTAFNDLAVSRLLAKNTRTAWSKTCACCGAVHYRTAWDALPLLGFQADDFEDQAGLELRNCPCGSTLACPVLRDGRLA